ncbi:hypothetical protein GCM10011502_26690 [Oceanisphaera marina]|uniref:DUF3530 domain-containing protein n=1 Tax=Oceanisphaera marina TaxID=2017550 RepID=A0ABQ1IWI7_9GAMM|nr:DUF3530 family protein [Oceanisphaera marina]GGB52178.1 hypothetical protein GCM10011502_26690 [Oceanisphaera marina]
MMFRRQGLTGWALLATLLISTPGQAQLDWSGVEQYSVNARLLQYQAQSRPAGTLLIWPELNQTHHWLPIAHEWQRRGWQVLLLQARAQQQQFDPTSEQPSPRQNQWLEQLGLQLSNLLPDHPLPTKELAGEEDKNTEQAVSSPLVVITEGSAALWFQQLVDGGAIAQPQTLILFDALPYRFSEQQMLAISLARSPYPILDIFSRPDSPLAWHNQQRRQQQLNRREKTGYAIQRFHDSALLNKQIAGWLVRLGWIALPPSAPDYLKEQRREIGISRSTNAGTRN